MRRSRTVWVAWAACIVAGCGFTPAPGVALDAHAGTTEDALDASACQGSGWSTVGGNNYQPTAALVDWGTAAAQCATVGGHLEKITASDENGVAQTKSIAAGNVLWLGLKNLHLDGVYYWSDGSELATSDYHNFFVGGIPADNTKPCVAIAANGEWYLNACYSPTLYQGLCECP